MGRKARVSLYRLFSVGGKYRYVPIVRKGRGWAPKTEPTGTPGSYYLRYLKNGRRTFESVGDDLQVALQELKARQASLNVPTPVNVIAQRKTVRTEVQAFLVHRPKSWRYILSVVGDFYGWDEDPANFHREDFQAFGVHLAKLRPANKECLAPRTRKNYLKHVTQFLRSTGRVVIVLRNEQDATIAKATAVIPNTLVLTRADFPKVNKKIKDYYPRSVVDAMFAACKNLRELVMLALFYYTGCREDEVAHLRWTDIRWEAKEFFVREWWKDNWTTKTYEDKRIVFQSDKEGSALNLFWLLADGSGGLEQLSTSKYLQAPHSWSPDGQLLAFIELNPTTGADIWVLRMSDRKAQPFLKTTFNEGAPRFSPDGRWLAYMSNESGRYEIYVQPYPGPGGKWQISTEGGAEPVWNPNGRELFYRSGEKKMMAVDIASQPGFAAGKPRMLFMGEYVLASIPAANYDVSRDGQRFLMLKPSEQTSSSSLTQIVVVQNWFEELKQKVPTGKK